MKKRPRDPNQLAKSIVDAATADRREDAETNRVEMTPARKGGLKGGPARAAKLSPQKRTAIAKKAANSRWAARPKREQAK